MIFELYCCLEGFRRYNEENNKVGNYNIEEAFLYPLLKTVGDWWYGTEWSFEVSYNPEIDEKLKKLLPEFNLMNHASYSHLNNAEGPGPAVKEEIVNLVSENLSFVL